MVDSRNRHYLRVEGYRIVSLVDACLSSSVHHMGWISHRVWDETDLIMQSGHNEASPLFPSHDRLTFTTIQKDKVSRQYLYILYLHPGSSRAHNEKQYAKANTCLDVPMFDGIRHSRVVLHAAKCATPAVEMPCLLPLRLSQLAPLATSSANHSIPLVAIISAIMPIPVDCRYVLLIIPKTLLKH